MERTKSGQELTLKEIHDISIDIMQKIHDFCVENNIDYSLDAGSLLGAIRHKGFIPWDDDIDIIMTRPNYEKFCKSFAADGLKLYKTGDSHYAMTFARVVDMQKTLVIDNYRPFTLDDLGYWVDIFPIDAAPSNKIEFDRYMKLCDMNQRLANNYRIKLACRTMGLRKTIQRYRFVYVFRNLMACIIRPLKNYCFSVEKSLLSFDRKLAMLDINKSEVCGSLAFSFDRTKEYKLVKWFDGYQLTKFQDREFYILNGWNEYLTVKFGDYMKLPPIEQRVPHHNFYKVIHR